ncbi:hypothetical protein QUB13_19220 [Microcoleus sp. B4-D4]
MLDNGEFSWRYSGGAGDRQPTSLNCETRGIFHAESAAFKFLSSPERH